MTSVVKQAAAIAAAAHATQTDKAGWPYILHPARVADRVKGYGELHVATAWLHDVLEDSDVTVNDLRAAGIPEPVIEAVVAITKVRGEPRNLYYRRVKANVIARAVKLADILDNSDPARLRELDDDVASRLRLKYREAYVALS